MNRRAVSQRHRLAFSLVELSIVLVILGLLTGGILAGQSLIRAAELRSVSTEYDRYIAATHTFRDKYMGLPGDFRNATRFWNLQVVGSNCVSNHGLSAAGTPGVCDGDGNGSVYWGASAGNEANESFQFWRHLASAGLIEGTYNGLAGPVSNFVAVLPPAANANVPASRIGRAGYTISGSSTGTVPSGNPQWFEGSLRNVLFFGTVANYTSGAALKPEEAWNLDTKMDDGQPARGSVRTWNNTFRTGCVNNDTLDATYVLTNPAITCSLILSTNL